MSQRNRLDISKFNNLEEKTSAVPCSNKFGKHYQIIAFATKGAVRGFLIGELILPLPSNYKFDKGKWSLSN